jgi:hypothetical protein
MSKKVPVGKNKLAMEMMNVSHTAKRAAERLIASKTFDDDDDNDEFGEEPEPGISRFAEIEEKADALRRKQRSHSLFSRKRSAIISTTTRSHKKSTTGISRSRNVVSLSVCQMKKSQRGIFKRDGEYVEVKANRTDDYATLVQCLKSKFNSLSGRECCLFRSSGARILNEDVTIRDTPRQWTLGAYLQHLHTSPEVLRLGIGCEGEVIPSDEELSDEVMQVQQSSQCPREQVSTWINETNSIHNL